MITTTIIFMDNNTKNMAKFGLEKVSDYSTLTFGKFTTQAFDT